MCCKCYHDFYIQLYRVQFEKPDGTYHTKSELIFNATRFENDRVFRCQAENIVLQINREKPIASAFTLEVMCK